MHAVQRHTTKVVVPVKSEQELISDYMLVSTCWNNHALSIKHRMSSEKAIKLLTGCTTGVRSPSIRRKARDLMIAIIYQQAEPAYLQR